MGLKIVSTNLKIAKAALILIVASTCGHILSLGKEILVANYFGITKVMDAFYAAITVPNLINSVLLSTFGAVFIPIFIRYKLKDKSEANHISSVITNYLFIFFIFASLFLYIFAPWIIRFGFHGLKPETINLAIKMLRIVCFTLILSGLIGIMAGILNAFEHFAWPAFSQMFVTITTILFILFFVKQLSIFTLIYGLLVGLILQFIFLIPITKGKGYHHYFDFNREHPAIKEMISLSFIFFIAMVASQLNIVVDRIMASYLAPGSIAALGYAGRLVQVPLVIFSSSIAIAVFPFFSSQIAENKIEEMKDSVAKSIRMSGFIFIPLTVILVILAKPIITLLFQRGLFDSHATNLTSIILICYSFQFFFYTVGMILARVFLAFQDMATLLKITIVGVIMNIVLNFLFIKIINPPAAGIALSTSVTYFTIMSLLFIFLKKQMSLSTKYILEGITKIIIASITAGIGIFFIFNLLNQIIASVTIINQVIQIGVPIIISGCLFIGTIFLLKMEEVNKFLGLMKSKVFSFGDKIR
ncbi:MAG TPA: murein biosynthesis integral membrane protein MurJ [bacterium]|nr:murein biosynthesis integral membrane protein MurJ [bacterium]